MLWNSNNLKGKKMKTIKGLVLGGLLLSATTVFAYTVGISAPASERGDVCKDVAYGVSVCRSVVNIITGSFEARSLSVSYSGRLAKAAAVYAYVSVNGQGQTSQLRCGITGASRASSGYMACTMSAINGYQSNPALLSQAASNEAWNLEMAFTDGQGNWDKNGNENYKTNFTAAQEQSNPTGYFEGNCALTYQAKPKSVIVSCESYVPKFHQLKLETGVFIGAKINGKDLPTVQMTPDNQDLNYTATIDLTEVPDGSLEIYFHDGAAPINYDSNFGQNYAFTLRTN